MIFETKRLHLRQVATSDAEFIVKLVNTPNWLKYIGNREIYTQSEAESYINSGLIPSYNKNNFGLWVMELKTDSRPIGICGLVQRDYLDKPDIGFALLQEFERLGYTFEAANATLKYAQETLGTQTLYGITDPMNNASINLLKKLGFSFYRKQKSDGGVESTIFRIHI